MKNFKLTKRQAGKSQVYEVWDQDKLLAKRKSDREYVACIVSKYEDDTYSLPFFFGRYDLMNKWLRNNRVDNEHYFLATMEEQAPE